MTKVIINKSCWKQEMVITMIGPIEYAGSKGKGALVRDIRGDTSGPFERLLVMAASVSPNSLSIISIISIKDV